MDSCSGLNWSVPRYPEWQLPQMVSARNISTMVGLLIIIFGSFANCITILTLWRYRALRSSTRIFMLTLAISDFVGMPPMMLHSWFYLQYGYNIRDTSAWLCKLYLIFGQVCINISWVCLFFIALERLLLVTRPLRPNVFLLSEKRGIAITLSCVAIVAVTMSCINLFYARDSRCKCRYDGQRAFILMWHVYVFGIYTLVSLHLLISGIIVLVKISQQENSRVMPAQSGTDMIPTHPQISSASMTGPIRMVLVTAVFQFLCLLPLVIWNNIHERNQFSKDKRMLINNQLEMIFFLKFSVNFFIFMSTSKGFRVTFRTMRQNVESKCP